MGRANRGDPPIVDNPKQSVAVADVPSAIGTLRAHRLPLGEPCLLISGSSIADRLTAAILSDDLLSVGIQDGVALFLIGGHWSFAVESIVAGIGGFCNPPVDGFLIEHQIGNAVVDVPILYKGVT